MNPVATTETAGSRQWPGLLGRIFTPERRRFLKFAIVGGSGVVVNLAVVAIASTWLFAGLGDERLAHSLTFGAGILVSIFTNFLINDNWTWADRRTGGFGAWLRRLGQFYLAASLACTVQWVLSMSLASAFDFQTLSLSVGGHVFRMGGRALGDVAASLVAIAVATPINYVVNHFWTYRERPRR